MSECLCLVFCLVYLPFCLPVYLFALWKEIPAHLCSRRHAPVAQNVSNLQHTITFPNGVQRTLSFEHDRPTNAIDPECYATFIPRFSDIHGEDNTFGNQQVRSSLSVCLSVCLCVSVSLSLSLSTSLSFSSCVEFLHSPLWAGTLFCRFHCCRLQTSFCRT